VALHHESLVALLLVLLTGLNCEMSLSLQIYDCLFIYSYYVEWQLESASSYDHRVMKWED
jgi:hypothetical protein